MQLLSRIKNQIQDLKSLVEEKIPQRQHIPMSGKKILEQQLDLAVSLENWINEFVEVYPELKSRENQIEE